jgi:signal transduction histidine kinase
MTDLSQAVPAVAIVVLVLGLVYMQRRLSLLEDREQLRKQQQQLNVQMRRFAELTMRLLGGEEARAMAQEVADAIAGTTIFSRVIIAFSDGVQLNTAGDAGVAETEIASIKARLEVLPIGKLQECCGAAERLGPKSLWFPAGSAGNPLGTDQLSRDSVIIPICSPRTPPLGLILLQTADGKAAPTPDNLIGVELLASHITQSIENTSAKKRTFQSEKLEGMGQLVAGVAHELNNPLTAVLGYTEILAEKTNDPSVRYDLSVMRREALRMKRIIESLQQFSRKQRVEREKVNVGSIIEETLLSRADEIREQKIEIVKQVDASLPEIVANQALIDQVFQHVFANAMEAVSKAGLKRILIEARALGDQVHLQVSDSGPGFKDASRVFDPFYTTKGPGKGTGLGLSLCYGIIRDHSGEITASNLHPLGACISIQLPLVSLEARSHVPSATSPVIR